MGRQAGRAGRQEGPASSCAEGSQDARASTGSPWASLGCSPLQAPPHPTVLCLLISKRFGRAWELLLVIAKPHPQVTPCLGGAL